MSGQQQPQDDQLPMHKSVRMRFDPTINLGHILTFVAAISIGTAGYFDLRKADVVHDMRLGSIEDKAKAGEQRLREDLRELRDDMRGIRVGIDRLNERMAQQVRP